MTFGMWIRLILWGSITIQSIQYCGKHLWDTSDTLGCDLGSHQAQIALLRLEHQVGTLY
ncbi:hypothetical protein LCGC14_2776970, partial [marine sediment metagenome]